MSLPPALVFDLSARRVVSVDRYEARSLIAAHRAGAVHPVPGDILPLLWWEHVAGSVLKDADAARASGVVRDRTDMAPLPDRPAELGSPAVRGAGQGAAVARAGYVRVAEGWYRRNTPPRAFAAE